MASDAPPRRRNATATREAILKSARAAFARSGYDGTGVREIAQGAGVTAMMINRYFGSKEQLFAEVVADTMADPVILTRENLGSEDLAASMARALVDLTAPDAEPLDGFQIMFHSAASRHAAEISRDQIEQRHQRAMTQALSGGLAPERAALALSLVAGVQVMRQMIGLKALTEADPEALEALLTPLFRALIEGEG
ncbi:TetR/AcrR family transcriptional regulator [Caulobacter mirabilis]|uniref:TetR family transcriptional regulator n=1 Tax=Caulobacter mirabilis TaxID=69666 RepID=A0A2D2AVR4_9CAUL|nr:TetR/AcrR family transcriptional regulator [Caulobacter mirabilis]ATQ42076.1 TetR family transcriptional regulator [Caulobacter mirabilis]